MNAIEAERRRAFADQVEALFRSRPGEWIDVDALMGAGGRLAWRTRVSDARKRLKRAGDGDIEWNRNVLTSAYRFVPCATPTRDGRPLRQAVQGWLLS
jgi:hypothetical protein